MKINATATALLAATAAAVPLTSVGTTTTSIMTWPGPPTSATTAAEVEVCMMPNKCGPTDKTTSATPEPAETSAAFEACAMPDGCSDNLHKEGVSKGLPQATPTPING